MEQIKRITGDSVHLISVNGDKPLKLSQINVGGGGGSTRPHYTGQTEFTPSTVTQTAQTEGLIVDSNITVNAMPIGSAKTPTVNVEANPTITMDGNGLVTASYSKTESITPNVTAGYVASGTAGNVTFRGSSTYQVPSGSAVTPTTTITASPSIAVSSNGLISVGVSASQTITPTVTAGYVSAGTAGTVNVSGSATSQLSTQAGATITPTESEQTAVASGKYTTGAVKVAAIPSNYIGSAVPSGSLSVSGSTVTAASGFYPSAVSANVASGYLGATTVIAGQTASTHTYKVERQAATSGWYEASAVRNAGTVTLNNQSISATPTESAQTFTPTNSVSYITQVTVNPIPSEYIVPSGTLSITSNASGVDVSTYAFADVAVPMPTPTLESKSITLTPSTASVSSSVTYDAGYDGLSQVDVNVDAVPTATVTTQLLQYINGSYYRFRPRTYISPSGYVDEGYKYAADVDLPTVPSGMTVDPSTTAQTIGGSSYYMLGSVTVNAVASASHTVGLTATYKNAGGRMFSITPKDTVTSAGWIAASTWTGNEWLYPALSASTYTPGSTPIVIGSANTMLEGAQTISGDANLVAGNIKSGTTIFGVEGTYSGGVTPTGTITLSSNSTGVDVAQYAFADVAVPWTWMGEEPTVVNSSFYSDSLLLSSTSYNGWTGSTTAKVIVASASAGTFVASEMSQYEYLINWQMDVSCTLKSTATTKAIPIRECANVWQLVTRRPSSLGNISSDIFNGNTAYTYFTAPWLKYYNTSGSSTYTWSNSYGIYGTVQTPTFSSTTADSPTVTLKTPIWYARCSSTYFATGRVGGIDQTETTLKRTCKIYRVKKGTPPWEMYEGLVNIINNPL